MKNEKFNKIDWNKKSGLKTGYSSKNKRVIQNPQANSTKAVYDYGHIASRYPTGIIPFVSLIILWVVGLAVSLGVGISWDIKNKENNPTGYIPQQWYNILWYITAAVECIVGLWALGRAGFLAHARYGLMKFNRMIKLSKIRTKIKQKIGQDLAIDDVNTVDEWMEFLELRKRYTKKWWTISWITFTSLFGVVTLLMLIMGGVSGAFN